MCGFAGVVSFWAEGGLDPATAADLAGGLSDDLAHRGPDGAGVWSLGLQAGDPPACPCAPPTPRALLVHRRLAVIDPTPRSDQPFTSADGRLVLLFNGEIYNFQTLRDELSRDGRTWRTRGDTEVLLAAYEAWGERCADRLEGMFAFAVLDLRDPQRPLVFLARDAAGQKPLFVALQRERDRVQSVAFASELSALRRVPWVDLSIDATALREYLAWGYVPGPRSIHAGAGKLLPGHVQTIAPDGTAARRYFDAGGQHELTGDDRWASAVSLTRALVNAAVARQLVSDVPIGSLLSGGIDSSVVTLCMARALREQGRALDTFSIGFDDARYDESAHAAEVARHLGTRHHAFRMGADLAARSADDLPRLARAFGEPFADSSAIPTHYLAQQARRHVTVALGGDGGDEIFGGYDRYRALRLAARLDAAPLALRRALATASRRLGSGHPKSLRARARRLGESLALSPGERYAGYVRLFSRAQVAALMPGGTTAPDEPGRVAGQCFDEYQRGRDGVAVAAAALDRATYLPGDLLVKLDRCSMLYALEVRSPFLDEPLLRFAGTLGDGGLLDARGGKRLLRDAFASELPASVFKRRKMGFAVPIGEWFRGPLLPVLRETLLADDAYCCTRLEASAVRAMLDAHERGAAEHGQRLYVLLMLELWWRDVPRASRLRL